MRLWTFAAFLVFGIALGVAPPAAVSQDRAKERRVGVLLPGGAFQAGVEGLREGLKALGRGENGQFRLVVRDGKGELKAIEAAAKALEHDGIDVIVAFATSVAVAAKSGTMRVPIVFVAGTDPVASRLAESVARPAGRTTGIYFATGEHTAKRLEIMHEAFPTLRRVVTSYNPDNPVARSAVAHARDAARQLGIELRERPVRSIPELRQRLEQLRPGDADAYFFISDSMVSGQAELVLERANALRMPAVAHWIEMVKNGALLGYGESYRELGRLAARYVDRILAGARPGDLPVEAVDRPALAINLKTAAALGLKVPPSVLARTDEVFD